MRPAISHRKASKTEIGDDIVDNDDEGTCRTADLHRTSAGSRDDETADDRRDETDCRADTAGDTECDGKRQSHNAYHDSGHKVIFKLVNRIIFQSRNQFRLEIK